MNRISIVEFSKQHAKAVAEMWNASTDGWNGRNFCSSEAKVLQEESSSTYLNLYLAIYNEQVLGYAKLTKYSEEPGVAYIELLNVLPTHHGLGIGRDLVKQCILRAAELGYDRIDLFTWAGNTKAVPLYKKCGFFWEKMDNQSTHLMNFLPGLLNMELLKPLWQKLDWYADGKRELITEPDGRRADGFDLYDYIWEKDKTRLEVSFERFGRGMVAIKTNEYRIQISADAAKPVFGTNVAIHYQLENYSNKDIILQVDGCPDGVISHEFHHEALLERTINLSSNCYIEPLSRKLHEWEKTPCAQATLRLDGEKLPLAIGLKVQYPLSAELRGVEAFLQPGQKSIMFLNLESHFMHPCHYRITFPDNERISLSQHEFEIDMEAGACQSIALEYSASMACAYHPKLQVEAAPQEGKPISFTLDCFLAVHCPFGQQAAETSEFLYLLSGRHFIRINTLFSKNTAWFGSIFSQGISLMTPMPGKPYSEELELLDADEILLSDTQAHLEAELRFSSRDIEGFSFAWIYRLYPSGYLEIYPRLLSSPEGRENLWLKLPFSANFSELCYWYEGNIISSDPQNKDVWENDLPENCPQENWFFVRNDDTHIGLVWPQDTVVAKDRWCLSWQVDMEALQAKGRSYPQPLQIHLDVFSNAWQLRNYAKGRQKIQSFRANVDLMVNNGDPVLKFPCRAEIIQALDTDLKAEFRLQSHCLADAPPLREFSKEGACQKLGWQLTDAPPQALERISATILLPYTELTKAQVMLHSRGECQSSEKDKIITIDNGIISFAAARDASIPGLISLSCQQQEFLDNAYPEYAAKGFLNPYPGGLSINPSSLSKKTMQAERHSLELCSRQDQWGNRWQGLAQTTRIENYEPLKGLVFRQLYLCLPGVPILAVMGEICELGGRSRYYNLSGRFYPKRGSVGAKEGCKLCMKDQSQHQIRWSDMEMRSDDWCESLVLYRENTPQHLQMVQLNRLLATVTNDRELSTVYFYLYTQITDPVPQRTKPILMIFDTELYDKKDLTQLLNLELS